MSDDQVRCPACGARNGTDAQWCTQCYASLQEPEPEPEPAPAPPPVASTPPPPPPPAGDDAAPDGLLPLPPPPPGTPAAEPRTLQAGSGRFRQTPDGLEWVCGTCGEWNSIDRLTCSVCGTAFGQHLGAAPAPRPEVAPAVLAATSLVLPGAGHWLLGLRGAAALRALLAVVWGLGGLTLFLQARSSGQSFLPAIPLLLGWAVVAAGSANDAVVEGGGTGGIVLQGRTLLWLTLAVIGGTFAMVLVGVLSAVGN